MNRAEGTPGRRQPQARRSSQSSRESNRPPRVSASRLVAYDVLRDVDERDAYANLALPSRIRAARLDMRDAALATELVAGTLRGQGRYDRIIEIAASRPVEKIDDRTLRVLRLGAHQLLSMRTAVHAAVNESVELQRKVANPAASGFVNGVLRSIARTGSDDWDERIADNTTSADEAIAARTSHPVWIVRALRDALRAEGRADELEALLLADNTPPKVSVALLPTAGIDAETAAVLGTGSEDGYRLQVAGLSPIGLELESGDPAKVIDLIDAPEGNVRVQDQGSQLAALALSRVRDVMPGERWLDLCAGPGGKTAVLGAEAVLGGASLRANEISSHRADLVRRSIVANEAVVEVVSHDGRDEEAFGEMLYDRILLDAPCSGLGALRRRPEARWRKRPGDLPELISLQGELLEAAATHLAPGGVLAYVTCSPHRAETRIALDGLLKHHAELRELDTKRVLRELTRGGIDLAGDSKSAQLWPHRHNTDAMFIALVERPSAEG